MITQSWLFSQITTANLSGIIINESHESLANAQITVLHTPTGTNYTTVSQNDGSFSLLNLRVGGPYTVITTIEGYLETTLDEIYLELGKTQQLEIKLTKEEEKLKEVVVFGKKSGVFSGNKTGSSTNISKKDLAILPTISRSTNDFLRLDPSATNGSFGGRNDQFNNFSLDGAFFNNPFGLDAATPGGQTDSQPVSIEAIDQIQISSAPYDVTLSGFTGATINAVTKSGSNQFSGALYTYFRNQSMTGSKIKGEEVVNPKLEQTQFGASLGGPIIKNKLFFFLNFEVDYRTDLGTNGFVPNTESGAQNESTVLESDLIAVSNALKQLGYDPGAYKDFTYDSNSKKGLAKIDWNINSKHRLALMYNFLNASKEKPAHPTALGYRGPSASTLQFENSGYEMNNNLNSFQLELNSNFSPKLTNKLQAVYTLFDDFRNPFSTPAPVITIEDGNNSNYIIAGHEPFSINNTLDQKVIQITDNLNYTIDKHTFTLGSTFEKFSFKNSFNLAAYDNFANPNGYYGTFFANYASVADFLQDAANPYDTSAIKQNIVYAQNVYNSKNQIGTGNKDGWLLAKLNVGQLAFYIQDEWKVSDNFKLTLGLRADKPLYFNTDELIQEFMDKGFGSRDNTIAYYNPNNGKIVNLSSTKLPKNNFLISPRLGFNLDVKKNITKLRGGTGIFTGRFPFVWLGNQVIGANDGFFELVDPDFRWPQVWKTSIGIDHKFTNDLIVMADFAYSKDIYGAHVQNWGLKNPTGTLSGIDNRPLYTAADKMTNNAYVFTNSNKGSAFITTLKVQKRWTHDLFTSLAYNYLDSKEANSIEAEITGDAFTNNAISGNANDDVLAHSKYGSKHRFVGTVSKLFKYGRNDKWETSLATFFEYSQRNRFSYTYAGDINNDGSNVNDLLYIPTESEISSMNFTSATEAIAYNQFIAQDDYLSENRGQYATRYGALSPWQGRWDFKIVQSLKLQITPTKTHTIQLSFDLLNMGNLINSDWGVIQRPTNIQPVSVNVNNGVPTYSFNTNLKKSFVYDNSLESRWQAQLGIRYIF